MNTETTHNDTPSRREVFKMFDRIAHRYDFLNHLLSLNRDKAWRKRLATRLPDRDNLEILDLATGTADQLLALFSDSRVKTGVGLDPAEKMLEIGRRKIKTRKLDNKITLKNGSAEKIPFEDNSFDAVTITFGIRNVTNVPGALSEMNRVLKPNGRALILEFSLPNNRLIRKLYLFYFRKILPGLGGLISGDAVAYRYLNETVETFPFGQDFCDLMQKAGFENVQAYPFTFGVASLYTGDKP